MLNNRKNTKNMETNVKKLLAASKHIERIPFNENNLTNVSHLWSFKTYIVVEGKQKEFFYTLLMDKENLYICIDCDIYKCKKEVKETYGLSHDELAAIPYLMYHQRKEV